MQNKLIRVTTNNNYSFYTEFTSAIEAAGYSTVLLDLHNNNYTHAKFTFRFQLSGELTEDIKRIELAREHVERDPGQCVFVDGLEIETLPYLAPYLSLLRTIPCDVFVVLDTEPSEKWVYIDYDKYIKHMTTLYGTLIPPRSFDSKSVVEDPEFGTMDLGEYTRAYIRNKKINEII